MTTDDPPRLLPPPRVGAVIGGRYELEALVAEGGMGVIYRAQQQPLGRSVAVKLLRSELSNDPSAVARFKLEAKTISQLSHPDIITLFDYGVRSDGLMYLVMEWLEGEDVGQVLRRDGRLELGRAVRIAEQIARALVVPHHQNIIHRDLKPENIFLLDNTIPGQQERIKLLDFGIAKLLDDSTTPRMSTTGGRCGTPAFMSPEQIQGESLDARSDLYALGCLLFSMLTGCLPFSGRITEILTHHQSDPLPLLPPPYPPELNEIIQGATQKNPNDRYASAGEMAKTLARFLKNQGDGLESLNRQLPSASVYASSEVMMTDTMTDAPDSDLSNLSGPTQPDGASEFLATPTFQDTRPPLISEVSEVSTLYEGVEAIATPRERITQPEGLQRLSVPPRERVTQPEGLQRLSLTSRRTTVHEGLRSVSLDTSGSPAPTPAPSGSPATTLSSDEAPIAEETSTDKNQASEPDTRQALKRTLAMLLTAIILTALVLAALLSI